MFFTLFSFGSGPERGDGSRRSVAQLQFQTVERRGASFLAQLTAAIKEESWKLRLLALAWTAGPVTFVALLIGFRLGYGVSPPGQLYIYFGGYTVIVGLISLVVGVLQRATVAARRKALEEILSDVIAKIPDLIVSVRNLGTYELSSEARRLRGAQYLLGDPDATEASIETAVEDLTGSASLARRFRRLESFRKKGLMGLVREEGEAIRRDYEPLAEHIRSRSRHVAFLLESRMAGRAPSKRLGMRRRWGFIRRLISQVERGELAAMQLADTEDLLKFLLELLMDRRFLVLRWKLSGDHPLVAASRRWERLRRERQKLERKRRLAKYAVIGILDRGINKGPTPAFPAEEAEPQAEKGGLYPFTLANIPDFSRPEAILAGAGSCRKELQEYLERIERYRRDLAKIAKREAIARREFSRLRDQYRRALQTAAAGEKEEGVTVRLEQDRIYFRNEDKIRFARHLQYYFANLTTDRERTRVLTETGREESQEGMRSLSGDELKGIVLRIFGELEDLLDLGEDAVIESLEASAAINVSAIEYSLSRRTKIGWLQAMVEDMEENARPIALRAAERMGAYLQGQLPKAVARELSVSYRLPLDKLLAM